MNNAPIGIFDSGFGGLTVARTIREALPQESIVYFGDTARCPYGPRPQAEVQGFVRQICGYLREQGVKIIVIACNTATAAGLAMAQREFDVPIIGVVEPGARAAVRSTRSRKVGVLATQGTVDSGAYNAAIAALDAGVQVTSVAAPLFVDLVERGLREDPEFETHIRTPEFGLAHHPEKEAAAAQIIQTALAPGVDTLVLGCTHFPVIEPLISRVAGPHVRLINSARETAHDVMRTLELRDHLCEATHDPVYTFATTSCDPQEFEQLGEKIFGASLDRVHSVNL